MNLKVEENELILVLISDFMQDEIYLNTESQYYEQFDKVIFFSTQGHIYQNKRLKMSGKMVLGERDISYKSSLDRASYLIKGIKNIYAKDELGYILRYYKANFNVLRQYILFTAKAELLEQHMRKYLEIHIKNKEEKIVFYSYRFGIGTLASIRLSKILKNSKVITRCHGQDLFEFRNDENYLPYRKVLYEYVDKIFCISEDGKNYIKQRYPQYVKKIDVCRLGTKDKGISKYLLNKPLSIVSCSRIVPIKRLEMIADALCMIDDISITWTHYGNGDEEYTELIKKRLSKRNRNIKYCFKGFLDNTALLDEYLKNSFSVFVNVSESEGLPVSIMEAISVGMPVIATKVGGVEEIVKNKENGYLLDKEFQIKELVELFIKFNNMDLDQYKKMCFQSRKLWEENFFEKNNYQQFVNKILEIYGED